MGFFLRLETGDRDNIASAEYERRYIILLLHIINGTFLRHFLMGGGGGGGIGWRDWDEEHKSTEEENSGIKSLQATHATLGLTSYWTVCP